MNPRLISPLKRPNSSYYWFRLVVPPRYRQAVGRTEIRESLKTDDIGEARRLCAVQPHEWLKRFAAIDVELSAREAQQGIAAVDRFLERQAAELGGMDQAISFELKSLALSELGFIDAVSAEDLGLGPGEHHPLAETVYPGYRKRDERGMIDLRRSVLATTAAAVVPGYEALDRAASLGFDQIAHGAIAEAFEHAGLDVDEVDPRFTAAARYLLDRLRARLRMG